VALEILKKQLKFAFGDAGMSTRKTLTKVVGIEVFTAVVLKSIIFWDMTPCSP
jgi:hypothetical protein